MKPRPSILWPHAQGGERRRPEPGCEACEPHINDRKQARPASGQRGTDAGRSSARCASRGRSLAAGRAAGADHEAEQEAATPRTMTRRERRAFDGRAGEMDPRPMISGGVEQDRNAYRACQHQERRPCVHRPRETWPRRRRNPKYQRSTEQPGREIGVTQSRHVRWNRHGDGNIVPASSSPATLTTRPASRAYTTAAAGPRGPRARGRPPHGAAPPRRSIRSRPSRRDSGLPRRRTPTSTPPRSRGRARSAGPPRYYRSGLKEK